MSGPKSTEDVRSRLLHQILSSSFAREQRETNEFMKLFSVKIIKDSKNISYPFFLLNDQSYLEKHEPDEQNIQADSKLTDSNNNEKSIEILFPSERQEPEQKQRQGRNIRSQEPTNPPSPPPPPLPLSPQKTRKRIKTSDASNDDKVQQNSGTQNHNINNQQQGESDEIKYETNPQRNQCFNHQTPRTKNKSKKPRTNSNHETVQKLKLEGFCVQNQNNSDFEIEPLRNHQNSPFQLPSEQTDNDSLTGSVLHAFQENKEESLSKKKTTKLLNKNAEKICQSSQISSFSLLQKEDQQNYEANIYQDQSMKLPPPAPFEQNQVIEIGSSESLGHLKTSSNKLFEGLANLQANDFHSNAMRSKIQKEGEQQLHCRRMIQDPEFVEQRTVVGDYFPQFIGEGVSCWRGIEKPDNDSSTVEQTHFRGGSHQEIPPLDFSFPTSKSNQAPSYEMKSTNINDSWGQIKLTLNSLPDD